MFGPDANASLTIEQTAMLVEGVRKIDTSMSTNYSKDNIEKYNDLKVLFGKSLTTKHTVRQGNTVVFNDLEASKPGNKGISAKHFEQILGKKWVHDLPSHHFINEQDFE